MKVSLLIVETSLLTAPLGCYILNLFKFAAVPLVDERVDTVRRTIIIICNGKKLLIQYFEEANTVSSKCFNVLKDGKLFLTQIPLVDD